MTKSTIHITDKTIISNIRKKLLAWYDQNKRQMPWRNTRDPYKIWVSEIMLQQTQVKTVTPYYERFIKKYPRITALAVSDLTSVLKSWEGLGYYSRARNLHKAAQILMKEYKGHFPSDYETVLSLPGIGQYTAGAICSIAFDQQVPVLDGNVIRFITRIFGITQDPGKTDIRKKLWSLSSKLLPTKRTGDFNQGLMEIGATICLPRTPLCEQCPVKKYCIAKNNNIIEAIPFRKKAKRIPHYTISAGIIWNQKKKILISQRPLDGMLGGLWEFPGGKKEQGETLEDCLIREIKEELGIVIQVDRFYMKVDHAYSHFKVTIHFFHSTYLSGRPKKLQVADYKWVKHDELKLYPFPTADIKVINNLLKTE